VDEGRANNSKTVDALGVVVVVPLVVVVVVVWRRGWLRFGFLDRDFCFGMWSSLLFGVLGVVVVVMVVVGVVVVVVVAVVVVSWLRV